MVANKDKRRVVVEPELHKQMKLLALELDMKLQDLIHMALELFITKCASEEYANNELERRS